MKKKIIIFVAIVLGITILLSISLFFYLTRVEKITEQTGNFFDASGKELGSCVIEAKWLKLSDMPEYKTTYYNLDQSKIGSCEGESIGTKIDTARKNEPAFCNPTTLQEKCDPSIYPAAYPFCSKAKYRCNIRTN